VEHRRGIRRAGWLTVNPSILPRLCHSVNDLVALTVIALN
jgi:hypothetical protein